MSKKNYGIEGILAANKVLLDLVKQYEKEYRASGESNVDIENKLRHHSIRTEFSVDHIFFTNWRTDEVVYSFEL